MAVTSPDLIIRNADLIDGTGAPSRRGDLAVKDERIVAVGCVADAKGAREIDANGKALAPGFVDAHTHDDRALLSDPLMSCKVSQGVTTVVTGNCGVSLAPLKIGRRPPRPLDLIAEAGGQFFASFGEYLAALDRDPPALNAACQVGHSTLRVAAMDNLERAASAKEIKTMRAALEDSLEAGAIGLSTGLWYAPAASAPTEEIIAIARPLRDFGAIHTTHMRDEADGVLEALEETFRIGRAAEVPVVVSHHKVVGLPNHGRTTETLARIEEASRRQPIGLDVYPYIASSTILDAGRLEGASKVIVTWSRAHPEYIGQDLAAIAEKMGCSVEAAADRLQPAGAVYFVMSEADVRRVLSYPHTMIGSDGLPHDEHPHPRLWGTFPRVLGHYAREVGLFPLEEAVRRMTSLPATRFGLRNRGRLEPGWFADLVLFDPKTISDRASFEQPKTASAGIDLVAVNGRIVWEEGKPTGARPGKALRLHAGPRT